jgi:hypothetical protein
LISHFPSRSTCYQNHYPILSDWALLHPDVRHKTSYTTRTCTRATIAYITKNNWPLDQPYSDKHMYNTSNYCYRT